MGVIDTTNGLTTTVMSYDCLVARLRDRFRFGAKLHSGCVR